MAADVRQDPRVERTVAAVLGEVRRLLRTEGFESVTFGRVSRETGVSRTTLYRHWSRPAELISDAWSDVAPSNTVDHTPQLHDDLVKLFLAVRDVAESATMRRLLPALLASAQHDGVISSLQADFIRARRRPIVERLQAGIAEGQVAADADLELVVDLLSGPIFYRQLLRRERTSDRDVEAIVATVLSSVRPSRR